MSPDITYLARSDGSSSRFTVTTIHRHHYPPQCPARHPPNRSWHFVLNSVCGCDRCRLTSRTSHDPIALPLATPSPLSTVTTILLSAQQGTPQTDHGISS